MKKISLFLLGMIAFGSLSAQAYQKGDQIVMFGLGFGGDKPNTIYVADPITGRDEVYPTADGYDIKLTPVTTALNYQYGFHEYISIGAYISPSFSTAQLKGIYNDRDNTPVDYDNDGNDDRVTRLHYEKRLMTSWYYGIKAEGHFSELIGLMDELDLYAGISVGGNSRRERVYDRYFQDVYTVNAGNGNQYIAEGQPVELDSYSHNDDGHAVSANLFLGARYYFQENLGLYLELGLIHRYAQVGVSFVIR